MNDEPRLLAGRYEVGDLIGRGGMAEVHIGYDTRLGRSVAIKILRADLARDPSFQTRFRREAQAAAGLNHPSIVAVYDTGEDQLRNDNGVLQAVPFIVMEYVEGHTVRDILKGDVAAPIDEAVEITLGVLSGLDYAHHAGLVHRDIKPANVMLTPTGAVKVMDFGIARALADIGQTMTQTQAVVGTAQYLSPEQARGENVDARSDLYSTGCLLFELLTGRPPFIGDSPVSVAYQHVREQAPRPSQFASDVPAELDAVVAKALQKDRNARYSSAQEFTADLQRAIGGAVVPVTGAQPVGSAALGSAAWGAGVAGVSAAAAATPNPYAPNGTSATPTAPLPHTPVAGPTSGPPTGATAVMPAGLGGPAGWNAVMDGPPAPPRAPSPARTSLSVDDGLVEDDARKRRMVQFGIAAAAVVALIVLIATLFSLANNNDKAPEPGAETVTVPILAGTLQADAEARLTGLGLEFEITEEPSDTVDAGRVIRTTPEEATKVEPGSTVTLVVSTGADVVNVPDVRGQTQADAKKKLEDEGLNVVRFEVDHDPVMAADRATKTDPAAGEELERGADVVLYVADGQVQLTELRNTQSTEAQQKLLELGLAADIQQVETAEHAVGTVFDQSPLPGLVPQNSTVTIKVAKAVSTVGVPDVVGKTQSSATGLIEGAGLKAGVTNASSETVAAGRVISQNPAASTQVALGTTVAIVISTGPADPPTSPAPTTPPATNPPPP